MSARIIPMLRLTLLTLTLVLAFGITAPAQVAVNGGYATTAPYPAPPSIVNTVTTLGIPSVPAIKPPFAHAGPQAEPPIDESQVGAQTTPEAASQSASSTPVNL